MKTRTKAAGGEIRVTRTTDQRVDRSSHPSANVPMDPILRTTSKSEINVDVGLLFRERDPRMHDFRVREALQSRSRPGGTRASVSDFQRLATFRTQRSVCMLHLPLHSEQASSPRSIGARSVEVDPLAPGWKGDIQPEGRPVDTIETRHFRFCFHSSLKPTTGRRS